MFWIAPGVWWGVGHWHILFRRPIALWHSFQMETTFKRLITHATQNVLHHT